MKRIKFQMTDGFTLLEIIFVFLIMSFLSVTFIGQYAASNAELVSGIEVLKIHLRYVQAQSMSTSVNWYVQFNTAAAPGTYTLYKAGDGVKTFPGEDDTTVDLIDGMTVADGVVVNFDDLGRPYTDTAGTASQSGVRTVMTSSSGNITINPGTGYIP